MKSIGRIIFKAFTLLLLVNVLSLALSKRKFESLWQLVEVHHLKEKMEDLFYLGKELGLTAYRAVAEKVEEHRNNR